MIPPVLAALRRLVPSHPKQLRRLAVLAAGFAAAAALALLAGLIFFACSVRFGDDGYLRKDAIVAKLAQETPIYYLDGTTQLGSFFEDAHRRYVSMEQIPNNLVMAIVSSEDKNFFTHGAVDFTATAKAFLEGVGQGNFHRAGSSITQQTVKILFNDWEHSFRRKYLEAIAAFRLERLYSKHQILEFYLNQVHVTGNGNGIGIAARYYFNKDVRDLDLVEAAFIAGSVKNPTKFNPFTKPSQAARATAEKAAFDRKNYVLRRMRQDGGITEAEFKAAAARPVPFNRGEFQSAEIALIELVRRQLERPEILAALGIKDKGDLNHAGIKVYTTVDAQLQADAQLAVRRNLSRLDTILKGYQPEAKAMYRRYTELVPNEFYYGKVAAVVRDKAQPAVELNFGSVTGTIDAAALQRFAANLSAASGQSAASHLKDLLHGLAPGDVMLAQVVSIDAARRHATLELQKRPEINGGLIAIDGGEIRAVVSGFDTSGYNRSTFGTRQPGSVFKAIVFYAAVQLGWSILDPLQNEAQVFPYQNRLYFPHGAHESPYDDESMLYAGTESENIATVYLTAHLLDRLSFDDFKQVLGVLGLLPGAGETPVDFRQRFSKTLGVAFDKDGVREQQLENAVQDLNADLIFAGETAVLRGLRGLWWGRGYERELARLTRKRPRGKLVAEAALRTRLVLNNFQRLSSQAAALMADWTRVQLAVSLRGGPAALQNPEIRRLIGRFRVVPGDGGGAGPLGLAYVGDAPDAFDGVASAGSALMLSVADAERIWGATAAPDATLEAAVRLGGYLPLAAFQALAAKLDARVGSAMEEHDPFGMYQSYQHHDTRLAVGLNYLIALTKAMGVQSQLDPVLSFPLGTNAVSLAEIAKIYQTFIGGKTYRFLASGPANQLSLIRRIDSASGRVLYEAKRQEFQLVPPGASGQIQEILRKVVTNGTAATLMQELVVPEAPAATAGKPPAASAPIRVPAFGKTGTTNDFTNGTFAGILPYPTEAQGPLSVDRSYVIAAYAGFDDNQPMRHGRFRGFGGQVALPAWSEFARNVIKHREYAKFLDAFDLATISAREWPLRGAGKLPRIRVDLVKGTVLGDLAPGGALADAPPELSAEEAAKGEVPAERHEVYLQIPGELKDGVFQAARVVNPFKLDLVAPSEEGGSDGEDDDESGPAAVAPGAAAPGDEGLPDDW